MRHPLGWQRIGTRGAAVFAALGIVISATGLPMCVNLLSDIGLGCPMHAGEHETGSHDGPTHVRLFAADADQSCHGDSNGSPCLQGTGCPSGTNVAQVDTVSIVFVTAFRTSALIGPPAAYRSYLIPPLSPPPQA